jgi:iron complex transport system substrate-binding protein
VRRALAVTFGVALLLLPACGDDETTSGDTTETTEAVPEDPVPERIVSLVPSATEMLFAIGAGDQVEAADSFSNHPEAAPTTDLSAYEPNIEAISAYEPDLVVVDGTNPDLISGLETLEIDVHETPAPATLDGTYEQIEELGDLTGHEDEAADLVADMQADIEELVAGLPEREEPLSYYHELDTQLFTVTSQTFIGELYALAGLANIADPADADGQSGGYPQISTELLVDADPDLIFLADTKCCDQTAESFGQRPGFATLQAVTEGSVIELDDDVASRWGPRVVDFLREIVAAVEAAPTT